MMAFMADAGKRLDPAAGTWPGGPCARASAESLNRRFRSCQRPDAQKWTFGGQARTGRGQRTARGVF
jgi:hypothetical protein